MEAIDMKYKNGWTQHRHGSRFTYAFNDTYRVGLFVIYPASDRAIEWLDSKYKFGLKTKTMDTAEARIWWSKDESCGIVALRRRPFKKLVPAIAHEALHWSVSALDGIGWEVDPANDEPLAYLVEWATRQIVSACSDHP